MRNETYLIRNSDFLFIEVIDRVYGADIYSYRIFAGCCCMLCLICRSQKVCMERCPVPKESLRGTLLDSLRRRCWSWRPPDCRNVCFGRHGQGVG